MSGGPPIMRLLTALDENEEFRKELVQLAAQHGVDFGGEELSDDDLDAVTGGTLANLNLSAANLSGASVGGTQLSALSLQNALQKQQQTLQTLSNVSKMLHSTQMAIIGNIR